MPLSSMESILISILVVAAFKSVVEDKVRESLIVL